MNIKCWPSTKNRSPYKGIYRGTSSTWRRRFWLRRGRRLRLERSWGWSISRGRTWSSVRIRNVDKRRQSNFYKPFEVGLPPPTGFSFGIPPAKRPPSWGGPAPLPSELFCIDDGLSGPLATEELDEIGAEYKNSNNKWRTSDLWGDGFVEPFGSTIGALRSFVCTFFSAFPLWMSLNRALRLGAPADPEIFGGPIAGGGGGPGGGGGGGGGIKSEWVS